MVAAIGLLTGSSGAISFLGVGLTTSAGALTLAGTLVNVAGSFALNAILGQVFKPDAPKPENLKLNVRQSVGARLRHYGKVRVGGTIVYFRAKNGFFYRVIVHGHGEIEAVDEVILDRVPVTLDGSGWVTDAQYTYKGRKRVQILSRAGEVPSSAYAEIGAIWPEYDATYRLDGLWTSLTTAEQVPSAAFRKVYPNGEPSLELVARTSKVADPRTGLTAYSDNAALVIADYIAHPDGLNRPSLVNTAALIAAANSSDANVALAAGGSEKRWRLAGTCSLAEAPQSVLTRMLQACGGDLRLMPDGTAAVYVGGWQTPSVTLTMADVLEFEGYGDGRDKLDRFSELPFTYVDPALQFVQVTGDPWLDPSRAAEDGEYAIGDMLNLDMAPSHRQARHAAKIQMARKNPRRKLVVRFRPAAIVALYERHIRLVMAPAGIDAYFRIVQADLSMTDGSVTLALESADPADFTWSTAEEGAPQVLPDPDVSTGIPTPTNFAAAAQGVQASGSTFTAGIAAAWDPAPSDALSPELEYAPAGTTNWRLVTLADDATGAQIGALTDGASYDLRLRFVASDGTPGGYATQSSITASAVTTAPAKPTALAVTDLTGGEAQVSFIASATASIWKTEIRRDGTLIATLYTDPSEAVTIIDACGAGTFNWTARSINVSGVQNTSDAGPVSKTIT